VDTIDVQINNFTLSKIILPLPWERVRVRGRLENAPPHLDPLPGERMRSNFHSWKLIT
jgi:hypothetical protein